jgi:predicted anti-sigma-YlaC factor YlaD
MNRCPENEQIEAWLDGELPPVRSRALEAHLAHCRDCARDVASMRLLFSALRPATLRDPGPALTERILDRVAPSRVRRRQLTVLGWGYSAVSAVSTFAFISWIVRPSTHVWLGDLLGAAYGQLVRTGLFALDTVTTIALRLHHGIGLLEALGGWIAPAARALALLGADPWFASMLWAAVATCATLLWWIRPRPVGMVRRNRHVGILAF